ncbi:hypothetical protein MRX96_052867, partial [Rhipicephalus microplus]
QSVAAISIFAASITLVTVFQMPLFWCNVFIGLSGTLYTILGGLRGVVWTDCMQFMITLVAPVAVVSKIFIDASAPNSTIQQINGTDVARYIGNYSFDLTSDETIWACSLGTSAMAIYRGVPRPSRRSKTPGISHTRKRPKDRLDRCTASGSSLLRRSLSWSGIDPLVSWMRPNTTG